MATGKTKGGSTGLLMLPSSGQECVFDSFVRFSRSLKGDLKQHEATDNQKGASGCHSNSHTHSLPVTLIFLSRLAGRLKEVEELFRDPSPLRQVPRVPW